MDRIEEFGGFQVINFGGTLLVSFQLLLLVLGGRGIGRKKRLKR